MVAGMTAIAAYERELVTRLIDGLEAIPGITIHGITDRAAFASRVPTVSISIDGVRPRVAAEALGRKGIYVWDGDFYATSLIERLGKADVGGVLRLGLVHYNTTSEVDRTLEALARSPRAAECDGPARRAGTGGVVTGGQRPAAEGRAAPHSSLTADNSAAAPPAAPGLRHIVGGRIIGCAGDHDRPDTADNDRTRTRRPSGCTLLFARVRRRGLWRRDDLAPERPSSAGTSAAPTTAATPTPAATTRPARPRRRSLRSVVRYRPALPRARECRLLPGQHHCRRTSWHRR
jgi:hypothetical protein